MLLYREPGGNAAQGLHRVFYKDRATAATTLVTTADPLTDTVLGTKNTLLTARLLSEAHGTRMLHHHQLPVLIVTS